MKTNRLGVFLGKILARIYNALAMAVLGLQTPELLPSDFKYMIALQNLILKALREKRPYMAKIGTAATSIHPESTVTLWLGYGADSSPAERISELRLKLHDLEIEHEHLQALLDKQYSRMSVATKLWQERNASEAWPDLGELALWLVTYIERLERENAKKEKKV